MMARQVAYVVAELFRGKMSVKELQGPLGIAKGSGDALHAKEGLGQLIRLMAMIGVNLAVLNLLDPAALDGDHILHCSSSRERCRRGPERAREGALRHRQRGVPVAGLRNRYVQ